MLSSMWSCRESTIWKLFDHLWCAKDRFICTHTHTNTHTHQHTLTYHTKCGTFPVKSTLLLHRLYALQARLEDEGPTAVIFKASCVLSEACADTVYPLTPSWGHSLCCPTTDGQPQSSPLDTVWRCHPWFHCRLPLWTVCSFCLLWDQEHVACERC